MLLPFQALTKRANLINFKGLLRPNELFLTKNEFLIHDSSNKIVTINRFHFSISLRDNNLFEKLTPQQLKLYYFSNKSPSSLNTLIYLGLAMKKLKMPEFSDLLHTSKKILMYQIKENKQNPQEIAFGKFISLYVQESQRKSKLSQPPHEILEAYIDCYNYLTQKISQHLIIYEILQNYSPKKMSENLKMVRKISEQKIRIFFARQNVKRNSKAFTLNQFIYYCRLFPNIFENNAQDFLQILLLKKDQITRLPKYDKTTLHYILKILIKRNDIARVIGFKRFPIFDFDKDTAKQICMKLQLWKKCYNLKTEETVINYVSQGYLNAQNKKWGYSQLIWLSDFMPSKQNSDQVRSKIHKALIEKQLGEIDWLISYIGNQKEEYYESLSEWLASQDLFDQDERQVCETLIYIGKYGRQFLRFHQRVAEHAMGRYHWETLNVIYYYGLLWESKDENLQFIRRYILNEYIAMGVSRRDIPTNSYFYKILQIANVEDFYANYFNRS